MSLDIFSGKCCLEPEGHLGSGLFFCTSILRLQGCFSDLAGPFVVLSGIVLSWLSRVPLNLIVPLVAFRVELIGTGKGVRLSRGDKLEIVHTMRSELRFLCGSGQPIRHISIQYFWPAVALLAISIIAANARTWYAPLENPTQVLGMKRHLMG